MGYEEPTGNSASRRKNATTPKKLVVPEVTDDASGGARIPPPYTDSDKISSGKLASKAPEHVR